MRKISKFLCESVKRQLRKVSSANLIRRAVEKDKNVVVGMSLVLVRSLSTVKRVHQADVVGPNLVTQNLKQLNFGNHTLSGLHGL